MKQILRITAKQLYDPFPDARYLESPEFEDRLQQYQQGDFDFIGIRVEAEILVNDVRQTIASGGLWGIESDSDGAYFSEIEKEETRELGLILTSLGFASTSIQERSSHITKAATWVDR